MDAPATFEEFLGNARAVEILRCAVAQNRLPHALIFAGPRGVGKHTLARLLAQMLNCLTDTAARPCGTCLSCRKIRSDAHPDVHELKPDGMLIKIDQVRKLISELAYQPFEGRYHVAILDPAEQMAAAAANSILKTLEEPASPSVLILVTTSPHALLGTILSRSRILTFGGIAHEEIAQRLVQKHGRTPEEARMAALLSNGSLSAAEQFDAARYAATRTGALEFVRHLLRRRGFGSVSAIAADLHRDKDPEKFPLWLDTVALMLQDVYFARHDPERVAQPDMREEAERLAAEVPPETVTAAIRAVKSLKSTMSRFKLNRQIALESLFLSIAAPAETISRKPRNESGRRT
jgi:DNA polymerase-3 subunit delta'